MKSWSSLSDPICCCIHIPQAEISLWNVPAEHFRSYVPNPTLTGFYTYTHSSPCLHSVFNLITLLHLISFPVSSSQSSAYLHFVFPFQKFTLFWTWHPSFPSPALKKEVRRTFRIKEEQNWDPSMREGEPGARDDSATEQDTTPWCPSQASRTGLRTVVVLPSSKSKVTSQAPSQASRQVRDMAGHRPSYDTAQARRGCPSPGGSPRWGQVRLMSAVRALAFCSGICSALPCRATALVQEIELGTTPGVMTNSKYFFGISK